MPARLLPTIEAVLLRLSSYFLSSFSLCAIFFIWYLSSLHLVEEKCTCVRVASQTVVGVRSELVSFNRADSTLGSFGSEKTAFRYSGMYRVLTCMQFRMSAVVEGMNVAPSRLMSSFGGTSFCASN